VKPSTTDYFIVAGAGLEEVAQEYAAYRAQTLHAVEVHALASLVSDASSADALAAALKPLLSAAKEKLPAKAPLYLLILGDAPQDDPAAPGHVPAAACQNALGGCTTDNVYGDLDGDGIPEAAVGRVAVHAPEDARAYLDKIRAHESVYRTGLHNRRVSLYTGEAGFSPEVDSFLEYTVMKALADMNHSFDITGAYNNKGSPYYYMPFEEKVVDLFNDGALMTVYIGHGSSGDTAGLSVDQLGRVSCAVRRPFVLFFACSNGEYAGDADSIAEAIARKPDGAVASIGASGISHPYGNAVLAYELQRAALNVRPRTFGEVILKMKRNSIENQDDFRQMIDDFAVTAEVPREEQALTKRQHLDLYNLFGDPAAAMNYPMSAVRFDTVTGAMAAGSIAVSVTTPGVASGKAHVTLEANRDMIIHELAPVDAANPDQATVQANWAKAGDKVLVGATVDVANGAFEATLTVPAGYKEGRYFIKVYADDGAADSYGSTEAP
jgi:hypothetical protein